MLNDYEKYEEALMVAEDAALSVFPLLIEYHVKRSNELSVPSIEAAAYDAFRIANTFLERREAFSKSLLEKMCPKE